VRYQIAFTSSAEADLAHFRVIDQRVIVDAIRAHLTTDAGNESRRRKRLTANPLAPWELRVGDHRVFYQVTEGDTAVTILAVGIKGHNDLFIRGRKVEL
jgi:mRNA-degrading endonuclease RelE of RelBE toxin-antitoxin system